MNTPTTKTVPAINIFVLAAGKLVHITQIRNIRYVSGRFMGFLC